MNTEETVKLFSQPGEEHGWEGPEKNLTVVHEEAWVL